MMVQSSHGYRIAELHRQELLAEVLHEACTRQAGRPAALGRGARPTTTVTASHAHYLLSSLATVAFGLY